MSQQTSPGQPRRRLWRRALLRSVVLAALVLVAAYATLPWWAPKDYLRRRLTEQLAAMLRLPVHVGSVSLDWVEGVRIHDLTIASPEGFSPAPMVRIDRIGADLSPITYLLTGRPNRLEVLGLHLSVESDSAGRLNVTALEGLFSAPAAPRVTVRGSSATFRTPWQEEPLRLSVTDLDLQAAADRPLGRITLSAVLAQEDQPAPIRFRLGEGDGEETIAVASLEFENLHLGRLPLRQLLPNVPLRRCAGEAEGWAELRIDNQGVINRCNANVSVSDLEIEPLEGPPLPTVAKAGLGLTATVDPITGHVWVRRLEVRLPGAELVGDGEFSAELLEGRWEAVKSVNVSGLLQPAELAALLTGAPTLPAGLEVDGPVTVNVASRFDGTRLDLNFAARGDAVAVRRAGRTIKPAGRAMSLAVKGQLDRRNWQFAADQAELVWGGNRFSGSVSLDDIRRAAPGGVPGDAWSALLGRLAASEGYGEWEIADWDAIHDALAGWNLPTQVSSAGPVTGRWFLDRATAPRVHVRAEAGPQARLSVGEAFVQPQGTAIVADVAAVIDAEGSALRDVTVDLAVGGGRLTVDRGEIRRMFDTSSPPLPSVVCRGQFEAEPVESLAACVPALGRWGIAAGGSMSGDVTLWFWPNQAEGELTVSMQSATLAAGRIFAKAPGQQADLVLKYASGNEDPPPPHRCRLTALGRLEGGQVSAQLTLDKADSPAGQATVDIQVQDAARLTENLPLLADALAGADLGGQAEVSASVRWEGPVLEGRVRCDAGGIEYASAGLPRRVKTAEVPLTMELAGRVTRRNDGDLDIAVDQARLTSRAHWAHLRGSASIRGLQASAGDDFDVRWARADLDLGELRGTVGGRAIAAGGAATLEQVHWPAGGGLTVGRLATDGLELRVGNNHGWVLGDLRNLPREAAGEFQVMATDLDDKDLAGWIGTVARMGCVEVPTTGSAPSRDTLLAEADRGIEAARKALTPLALHGRIGIDRYLSYDAETAQSYLARSVDAQLSVEDSRVSLTLDAAVKGGVVSRRYSLDLSEPSPRLAIHNDVRELMADESIQPQLTYQFPGNTVYGLFSRTEEVMIPLRQLVAHAKDPSAPVWPVGHAKTIATDGMLQGRAAPGFVTTIFPGLNLTRYRYNRMTAFAEYEADGTAVNDMVFSGQTYDTFIEGDTDADHIGHYEIGLILLGTPQTAEWNHTYRQGRIPLLKVRARIEGGKMHDETVSYPYPNQSLFTIFLKNNIFYRLWLASRR